MSKNRQEVNGPKSMSRMKKWPEHDFFPNPPPDEQTHNFDSWITHLLMCNTRKVRVMKICAVIVTSVGMKILSIGDAFPWPFSYLWLTSLCDISVQVSYGRCLSQLYWHSTVPKNPFNTITITQPWATFQKQQIYGKCDNKAAALSTQDYIQGQQRWLHESTRRQTDLPANGWAVCPTAVVHRVGVSQSKITAQQGRGVNPKPHPGLQEMTSAKRGDLALFFSFHQINLEKNLEWRSPFLTS